MIDASGLVYILYIRAPSTDPWGTPHVIECGLDKLELMDIL